MRMFKSYQNLDCDTHHSELWQLLLPFQVKMVEIQKFNIRVGNNKGKAAMFF